MSAPEARRTTRQSMAVLRASSALGATHLYFVPGRIEVLGKHTDYAGGRSLLCAVERGLAVSAVPRPDNRVRVVALDDDDAVEFEIESGLEPPIGHWSNYPMTVVRRLARDFPGAIVGTEIAFAGDLPIAAGLSSSSALVVGIFRALADLSRLEHHPLYLRHLSDPASLAEYLGAVENGWAFGPFVGDRGVGTAGGCEDHTAILHCEAGKLSQYAFWPVRHERTVALDDRWIFAVGVSGVLSDKTGGVLEQYNRTAGRAEALLDIWCHETGRVDDSLAAALASTPGAAERLRALAARVRHPRYSADDLTTRLEQFLLESEEIVPAAGRALESRDFDAFGRLVDRSQEAAESWLGNQIPETIGLQRAARELGAVAASAFGGGFGGSVWALVAADQAASFVDAWGAAYRKAFPERASAAEFFLTRPGPGLTRL